MPCWKRRRQPSPSRWKASREADRQRAEADLRKSEENFRAIANYTVDWECWLGLDRELLWVSPSVERITGYSAAECYAMRRYPLPLIAEEDRERIAEMFGRPRGDGRGEDLEFRIVRKDGAVRWVSVSWQPIYDADGIFLGHRAGARDTTERKRAEEALERSREEAEILNRIGRVFLSVPNDDMYAGVLQIVLAVMKSPHGIFAYIDEDGANVVPSMTGEVWQGRQMPDKTVRFPSETWGDGVWSKALRQKRSICSNQPGRVPPGHVPVRRALAVPIVHENQALGHFAVANKENDYTADDVQRLERIAAYIAPALQERLRRATHERHRQQAEAALRKAIAYNRSLIEASPDALVTIGSDGKITDANQATETATGYPRSELIGTDFADYFSDPETARAGYLHAFSAGRVRDWRWISNTATEASRPCSTTPTCTATIAGKSAAYWPRHATSPSGGAPKRWSGSSASATPNWPT